MVTDRFNFAINYIKIYIYTDDIKSRSLKNKGSKESEYFKAERD